MQQVKPGLESPLRLRRARAALSELFLDTELDERDFERLCRTLIECGLSVAELERIYREEVAPVLHANLKSVAGAWSGFDIDWLESQIRNRPAPGRTPILARLRRRWILRETRQDWERLRKMVEARKTRTSR